MKNLNKKIIFSALGIAVSLFLAWVAFLALRSTIQSFTSQSLTEINLMLFVVFSILFLSILLPFIFSIHFRESFLKQIKEMNYFSFSSFFLAIIGGSACSVFYMEDPGMGVLAGLIGLIILVIPVVISIAILSQKEKTLIDKILTRFVFFILVFLFVSFIYLIIKYSIFKIKMFLW